MLIAIIIIKIKVPIKSSAIKKNKITQIKTNSWFHPLLAEWGLRVYKDLQSLSWTKVFNLTRTQEVKPIDQRVESKGPKWLVPCHVTSKSSNLERNLYVFTRTLAISILHIFLRVFLFCSTEVGCKVWIVKDWLQKYSSGTVSLTDCMFFTEICVCSGPNLFYILPS